ncbi:hypothetical protein [Sinomonas flava]|uniref:RibD C-terminal domain-containing protein n=1 Tax=Sinomonas flava TaxID=496857 RepID=A0ABP5NQF0_9MICC
MGRLIVQETVSADGFAADPEGDIGCWGSLSLVRELLDPGEADGLRLVVAPSKIGQGRRFGPAGQVQLARREAATYDDALVALVYDLRSAD